jgi:hypothetical protein
MMGLSGTCSLPFAYPIFVPSFGTVYFAMDEAS